MLSFLLAHLLLACAFGQDSFYERVQTVLKLANPGVTEDFELFVPNMTLGTPDCYFTLSKTNFNMEPINRGNGPYFSGTEGARPWTYQMNICGSITAPGPCNDLEGGICQYNQNKPPVFNGVIGRWKDSPTPPVISLLNPSQPTAGLQIAFMNGDNCIYNSVPIPRTALVKLSCQPGTQTMSIGTITADVGVNPNRCLFTFTMTSPYACSVPDPPPSKNKGLSGGSIFLIILFSVGSAYLLFGFAYLYQVRGSRGMEACPNRDFWSACWVYNKEGCSFSYSKIRGLCSGGRSPDYAEL